MSLFGGVDHAYPPPVQVRRGKGQRRSRRNRNAPGVKAANERWGIAIAPLAKSALEIFVETWRDARGPALLRLAPLGLAPRRIGE